MHRYKVTKQLGDGTYGSVGKAQNRQTGEVVSAELRIMSHLKIRPTRACRVSTANPFNAAPLTLPPLRPTFSAHP